MRQVGWKHQQHPIAHRQHHLVCILGREFSNGRSDDAGLRSGIVKVDRIRTRMRLHIVNAAQEIIRVAMHRMRRAACVNRCPASGNFNRVGADFQELKYGLRGTVNA